MFENLPPIILNNISLSYRNKTILHSLNMQFCEGGISFLIGENGAGKTQLLRLIHGLSKADSGTLSAPPRHKQGYLQQNPILLDRSVEENLYYIRGTEVSSIAYFDAIIEEVIEYFGLRELLPIWINRLSGGQRKRIAIARLFLQQSYYYLLDEPSANLDHQQNLLLEKKIDEVLILGKKVLMSSHDFFQIERLFVPNRDEIWVIKNGRIIEKTRKLDIKQLRKHV